MADVVAVHDIDVRKAEPGDAGALLHLIAKLAEYEQLAPPGEAAQERLIRDVFGDTPRIEAYLAWHGASPVGYALILETYSSFLALPTLYLEDIFVLEEYRRRKAGLALFLTAARIAKERGCGRLDFAVLDWNTTAQDFYRRLGAEHLREWQLYRLGSAQLAGLPELRLVPGAPYPNIHSEPNQ